MYGAIFIIGGVIIMILFGVIKDFIVERREKNAVKKKEREQHESSAKIISLHEKNRTMTS